MTDTERAAEKTRIDEIRAAYGAKNAEFALKMISEGRSLEQARGDWAGVLETQAAAKDAEIATLKAAAPAKPTGNGDIPTGIGGAGNTKSSESATAGEGQARAAFMEKFEAVLAKCDGDKALALQRTTKKFPELHRAMLAEMNPGADLEGNPTFAGWGVVKS